MLRRILLTVFLLGAGFCPAADNNGEYFTEVYKQWKNGPPADPGFFPIGVWLQEAGDAAAYKAAGINTYVAVRDGFKSKEIDKLKEAGMYLICAQNETLLSRKEDKTIIAWLGKNEPDNMQPVIYGRGSGTCLKPVVLISVYKEIKRNDTSRPVLANFGEGLVIDNYEGRGPGAALSDYKDYFKAGDIISFNVYPVAGRGSDNLIWYLGKGLDRITEFAGADKIKWNFIETTVIKNPASKPKPANVRTEAWLSIIYGSKGLVYYTHKFKPDYDSRALLNDKEMLTAVTKLNAEIKEMAPVINSPEAGGLTVSSGRNEPFIKTSIKKFKGDTYIFAVPARSGKVAAKFELNNISRETIAEVVGEARSVIISDKGVFKDIFEPWQVHIYKIEK